MKINQKNHNKAQEVNLSLRTKRKNGDVVPYKGRYGFDCHLVMRGAEAEDCAQRMFILLRIQADRLGFGDEYNEIMAELNKFNIFLAKSIEAGKTGKYWEDIKIEEK